MLDLWLFTYDHIVNDQRHVPLWLASRCRILSWQLRCLNLKRNGLLIYPRTLCVQRCFKKGFSKAFNNAIPQGTTPTILGRPLSIESGTLRTLSFK